MSNDQSMQHHLSERLADLGANQLEESWRVGIILSSLPKSYDWMVSALEVRKEEELTMSLVQTKLIEDYKRRHDGDQNNGESNGGAVLKVSETKACFFCKGTTHIKKDCFKYKAWKAKQDQEGKTNSRPDGSKKEKANKIEETEEHLFAMTSSSCSGWLVDSGATSHVTNNKSILTSIDGMCNGDVNLADGTKTKFAGRGTCEIDMMNSDGRISKAKVTNVLYTPNIDGSMLSVRKFVDKGYTVVFDPAMSEIKLKEKQIAVIDETDGLYKVRQQSTVCVIKKTETLIEGCIPFCARATTKETKVR